MYQELVTLLKQEEKCCFSDLAMLFQQKHHSGKVMLKFAYSIDECNYINLLFKLCYILYDVLSLFTHASFKGNIIVFLYVHEFYIDLQFTH